MLVLNFLCAEHILFHLPSWLKVFQLFQFPFFLVKMVNHDDVQEFFSILKLPLQENILHRYLN